MKELNQDIISALLFIAGTWCFISGLFIVSTLLFASAAIFSNIVSSIRSGV